MNKADNEKSVFSMRRGRTFHKLQWKLHISTKNRHFTKLILSKYKLSINPWLSPPVSANAALYGNCSCLLRNGKHSLCQNNCMVNFLFFFFWRPKFRSRFGGEWHWPLTRCGAGAGLRLCCGEQTRLAMARGAAGSQQPPLGLILRREPFLLYSVY